MRHREIHVEPFDAGRAHQASLGCWCGPVAIGRDLDSSKAVVRHRTPPRRELTTYHRQAERDFASFREDEVA